MSRIGKKPITLPPGVEAKIEAGSVLVTGPLGSISVPVPRELSVTQEDAGLRILLRESSKRSSALWGLTRALLANAVLGVTKGFCVRLLLEGIGYRAAMDNTALVLSLGFSHPVRVEAPDGIQFSVEKNVISVSGFDKQRVGNTAAAIRSLRKPEPYKGKGIRREGEAIRRKAGKKAATLK